MYKTEFMGIGVYEPKLSKLKINLYFIIRLDQYPNK